MKSTIKVRKVLLLVITLLLAMLGMLLAAPIAADSPPADTVVGDEGEAAAQDIPSIPHLSHLGPGSLDITPASPTSVSNCIPFGNNTFFGFTGFIYRNVPPFTLTPGSQFAFDLGAKNSVDTRRNIYFAVANINPAPAVVIGNNVVVSQGIQALGWTQVASDTQTPVNPRGNLVKDDYELIYTAEAPFSFPGGGLIVGFGGSPPGGYADVGCEQVLVNTTSSDASGFFYSRFYFKPDQTLGVLDDIASGGSAWYMGGIVIQTVQEVDIDIKPGSDPNCFNNDGKGVIPVAILGSADLNVTHIDADTVTLEGLAVKAAGKSIKLLANIEDVNSDSFDDLVVHIEDSDTVFSSGSGTATLTGKLFDGTAIEGTDSICIVP